MDQADLRIMQESAHPKLPSGNEMGIRKSVASPFRKWLMLTMLWLFSNLTNYA